MPTDESSGLDDTDLPGLDDVDAPSESDPPIETVESPEPEIRAAERPAEEGSAEPEWSHSDLDEWFKEIGGDQAYWDLLEGLGGLSPTWAPRHPDLWFGMSAYQRLATSDSPRGSWPRLSLEAKTRLRRGWEDTQATTDAAWDELAPYDALETLVPVQIELAPARTRSLPRWIMIGGVVGVLGLLLGAWFFIGGGGSDDAAPTSPSPAPSASAAPSTAGTTDEVVAPAGTQPVIEETAPPLTTLTTLAVEETSVPIAVQDAPGDSIVFPTRWDYVAVKTAAIVPAPDFITATPIGTELPWAFNVIESCDGGGCSYTTGIFPLIPDAILGEIPITAWEIDGAEWTLDIEYQSVQSRNVDGTVCVISNHDLFELTVTEAVTGDRSVPVTFEGTWLQGISLDLEASTGNPDLYCGDGWAVLDEWSMTGTATS